MKKTLALILALSLILCLFAGCGESAPAEETVEPTEAPADGTEPPAEEPETPAYMTELLEKMNAHGDDTVVMTVNGHPITWDLFFYMLSSSLTEYAYYMGDLPADFSMEVAQGQTMEDYFNLMSVEQCKLLGAVMAKAAVEGVTPAPETDEEILTGWEDMTGAYGGEEALRELSFMTRNAYLSIMRFDLANSGIQTKLYGAQGELMADEDVMAWAEENQYVHVKHILYQFKDAEGKDLDEAGKAEVLKKAQDIQKELKALEGDTEALEARFDEIMNADSADAGGLMMFPDGYTFTTGEMVAEFEEAAFALGEYKVSEPVESAHGVHILLGLPMGPDDATMNQGSNGYYTLRQMAITQDYNEKIRGWIDEAEVVWAEDFENFTVQDVFPDRIGSGKLVENYEG